MADFKNNAEFFKQTMDAHPEEAKVMQATLKLAVEKGANAEAAMGIIAAHTHNAHMSTVAVALHGQTPEGIQNNAPAYSQAQSIVRDLEPEFHTGRITPEQVLDR